MIVSTITSHMDKRNMLFRYIRTLQKDKATFVHKW